MSYISGSLLLIILTSIIHLPTFNLPLIEKFSGRQFYSSKDQERKIHKIATRLQW